MLFDGDFAGAETIRFIEEKGEAGLWTWDFASGRMEWSRGLFDLLDLEPSSVEPSHDQLESMIHPEDARRPGEMELVLSTAGAMRRDFRVIQLNGRVRWLSSRGEVLLNREGTPSRAIGVIFDVSRQHEVIAAAEAIQIRFSSIVSALNAITWSATPNGHVGDLHTWCKITGQTLSEASGIGWLAAVHPDDRDDVRAAWEAAVASGTPYEMEYSLMMRDGQYRWVRSRAVPVRNKANDVREWVGLTLDIQAERVWSAPVDEADALTGAQVRAGRALVNWSVRDLSEQTGVSASTIRRLEESDGAPKIGEPAMRPIKAALEQRGVEFLFPPVGHPGVRLATKR